MKYYIFTLIILLFVVNSFSEDSKKFIREGNELFKGKKFNEAEIQYRKALDIDKSHIPTFNLGDALYKQGNYTEAADKFNDILTKDTDKSTKSAAYHNLGNSMLMQKKYDESIAAYKNALKNNPKDEDSRYNLEYAKKMIKLQQEQQNQKQNNKNQDKNQDENQKQNDKNQDKNNQDNQKQNKNNDNLQNKEDKQNSKQDDEQQNKQNQNNPNDKNEQYGNKESDKTKKPNISKEDAERILKALQNEEKNVQKKVRKQKGSSVKIEKNW